MNNSDLKLWIQEYLDVLPQNIDLYKTALTTRQYEALEFLGDSIIGFFVSEYLVNYKNHFIYRPGWLTKIRAEIVKNSNLTRKAREINLTSIVCLLNTSSQEQITDSVLADMLEALMGAVYQDQEIDKCKDVVRKILNLEDISMDGYARKQINLEICDLENKNPISALQELLAKNSLSPPRYLDRTTVKGSPHCPIWSIEVICEIGNESLSSEGVGNRKQKAKEEAARKLFSQIVKYIQN